jgi:hypothetical protein
LIGSVFPGVSEDEIARMESDVAADEADGGQHVMDHRGGTFFLLHFAVRAS